jgi:predicted RNA-binding protein with EMAP domain
MSYVVTDNNMELINDFIRKSFPEPEVTDRFYSRNALVYEIQKTTYDDFMKKYIVPKLRQCLDEIKNVTYPYITLLAKIEMTQTNKMMIFDEDMNLISNETKYSEKDLKLIEEIHGFIKSLSDMIQERYIKEIKDKFKIGV